MKKKLNFIKNVNSFMKKLINFFKKSLKKIIKLKGWSKIALITGIILIVLMIVNKDMIYREGFTKEKFILKEEMKYMMNFILTFMMN